MKWKHKELNIFTGNTTKMKIGLSHTHNKQMGKLMNAYTDKTKLKLDMEVGGGCFFLFPCLALFH